MQHHLLLFEIGVLPLKSTIMAWFTRMLFGCDMWLLSTRTSTFSRLQIGFEQSTHPLGQFVWQGQSENFKIIDVLCKSKTYQ